MKWRPISTARKLPVGTEILAYRPLAPRSGDDTITVVATTKYATASPQGVAKALLQEHSGYFETTNEELAVALADGLTNLAGEGPRVMINGVERRVMAVYEKPQKVWRINFI